MYRTAESRSKVTSRSKVIQRSAAAVQSALLSAEAQQQQRLLAAASQSHNSYDRVLQQQAQSAAAECSTLFAVATAAHCDGGRGFISIAEVRSAVPSISNDHADAGRL
jgi:hypothetical protein